MSYVVRILVTLTLLAAVLLVPGNAAQADTVSYSASLDSATFTRPYVAAFSNTLPCSNTLWLPGAYYHAQQFEVSMDGTYAMEVISASLSNNHDTILLLYTGSFDPADSLQNCTWASDEGGAGLGLTLLQADLTAGTPYILVTTTWFTGVTGDFTNTISGPGVVTLDNPSADSDPAEDPAEEPEPIPGCDVLLDIPAQAVMGTFVDHALIYWMPNSPTYPPVFVEAGKSYLVAGQDESGMYRKILISCEWHWVEVGTVGPNYDPPWNGQPLPVDVVE